MIALDWNGYRIAAWIGLAAMAGAVVALFTMNDWLGAVVSLGFLAACIAFMTRQRWHRERWLPSVFDVLFVAAALVNGGGWVWSLYNRVPGYDEFAHFFTPFAFALGIAFLIYHSVRAEFRGRGELFALVVATFGLSIGALWEIGEWIFISKLPNPIVDLIMDALGSAAAGVLAAWLLKQEHASE